MSDVKFEEDWEGTPSAGTGSKGLPMWLVNHSGGMIKEEKHAVYIIIGVMLVVIVISLFAIKAPEIEEAVQPPAPQGVVR